ncbi:HpcH/HpaI aldolase/citrate lyase family protein [Kurthia sibirica]|uniref:Citrate lyase subunit beta n=1 Tax=Kurthia sibirica TaxID=202750 RepID=A0A2U3AJN6_9BACL|nr:HpcH/HpaI aldolase/citrate lyase family protein [Kurthia sibirica]PWI24763.1 citrate lyase subunit beta [Kurthia sibirica]GEK35131.1 ATP/GTP-binding protein [Kurthia sibirica]
MKYFSGLSSSLFYKQPTEFSKVTAKHNLAYALGATLYMPADKSGIFDLLVAKKYANLRSIVIDLEDAISDDVIEVCEEQFIRLIQRLHQEITNHEEMPLLFVRVRNAEQLQRISDQLHNELVVLTGVVMPKFDASNAFDFCETLQQINSQYQLNLYAMPILESTVIMYKESRLESLMKINDILKNYKSMILMLRIGATDFSGLYGIRRKSSTTVHEIALLNDVIADILNMFQRKENHYVIAGPVYEYFNTMPAMDTFIREIQQNIENGIVGKTVIHPSHIDVVQALHCVTHEEYMDASSIYEKENQGVEKSSYNNKMNEMKPHLYWARRIIQRAEIFGVLNKDVDYKMLLQQNEGNIL